MSLRACLSSGLAVLVLLTACQQPPSADLDAPANELVGVWSLTAVDPGDGSPVIQPSQPGLYIFADGYYSAVFAPGSDPRIKSEVSFQPTQDEMVAQYETIIVNTGTYEISGSTVTFRPIIAKEPGVRRWAPYVDVRSRRRHASPHARCAGLRRRRVAV